MSKRLLTSLCAGLICLLVALPATAADWETAFGSSVLETYMLDGTRKVLVLTAGGDAEDQGQLRGALLDDINRLEGVTGVTVGALNDTDHDDETLRRKARPVPADVILIVRLFEKKPGRMTVVGTFYERAGDSYAAFALGPGESLQPRGAADAKREARREDVEEEAQPSAGLREKTLESVYGEPSESEQEPRSTKVREYQSRMLVVEAPSWSNTLKFGRSKYGLHVDTDEALRRLGRDDLADEYNRRLLLQRTAYVGTAAVGVGSAIVAVYGITSFSDCSAPSHPAGCEQKNRGRRAMAAGGITGSLLAIGGLFAIAKVSPDPLSLAEAETLVEEHNAELRDELGLEQKTEPMSTTKPALRLDLGAVSGGVGLMLRGSF